jgi:hypothetical protein
VPGLNAIPLGGTVWPNYLSRHRFRTQARFIDAYAHRLCSGECQSKAVVLLGIGCRLQKILVNNEIILPQLSRTLPAQTNMPPESCHDVSC